jgi:hypothetical protein
MSSKGLTKHIFQISYDTDETKDHTIDARKLGQAIISTSDALKNSNKVINGESSEIEIDVKAHSEGSFVVEFVTYINSVGVNPLSILGLVPVAAGTATVFGALKQLGERKIKMIQPISKGKAKLTLSDKTEIELPQNVADLISSKVIRDSIDVIVKAPLDGVKNAKFIVKDEEGKEVFKIEESEVASYTKMKLNIVDEVTEFEETKNVKFIHVNFEGASGWKVRYGDGETATVKMKDKAFLERINKDKEKFSKGDTFVVKIKTTKTHRHGTSPHYNREIIEVLRNRTEKGRQLAK